MRSASGPLLANIALGLIEERYERWVEHRTKRRAHRKSDGLKAALEARSSDRRAGRVVMFPVRYADDFVILVHGTQQQAEAEMLAEMRDALAEALRDGMGLTLSPDKTRFTDPAEGFQILGHRVMYAMGRPLRLVAPHRGSEDEGGGLAAQGQATDDAADPASVAR